MFLGERGVQILVFKRIPSVFENTTARSQDVASAFRLEVLRVLSKCKALVFGNVVKEVAHLLLFTSEGDLRLRH